jgi:polygalacturonase
VIDNVIENNGLAGAKVRGAGIHICGIVHDITIENNTIRETRSGADRLQLNAVFIEQGVSRVKMSNNKISGHPENAIVDNSKSPDNQLQ